MKINKGTIIILIVLIAFCALGAIIYYVHGHSQLKSIGPANQISRSVSSTSPIIPVDTGIQVTNIRQVEANPNSVFRLNISYKAPTSSDVLSSFVNGTSTVPPSVPASNYIPTSLFSSMTNLKQLNLDDDNIATLPPEIGTLENLQVLYLSGNKLATLPPEIGNLTNLWMLSLFQNQITSLPSTIAQLKNLKILGLTGNPITKSSTAMAELQKELPNTQILK